jgi:hypothetical protein
MCNCDSETTQVIHIVEAMIALISIFIGSSLLLQNKHRAEDPSQTNSYSSKLKTYFMILSRSVLSSLTQVWHYLQSLASKILSALASFIQDKIIPFFRKVLAAIKSILQHIRDRLHF